MELIETSVFTRQVQATLSDEEYRALQLALALRPGVGVLIPGSGGVRKLRWGLAGRGKRGGIRILYVWDAARDRLYLLFLFRKNERSDLTPAQLRTLRALVSDD